MTLLVEVLSPNVDELVLSWYVVGADLALLYQLTDAEKPQGYVLCASIAGLVPDDEKLGGSVVIEQLNGLEILLEPHFLHNIPTEHVSFIASAAATSSASIADMAVSV